MPVRSARPVVVAGALLSAALIALGWLDYRAATRELQAVVRAQAAALHATVAAAARAQHAAADHAEAALADRLLESARLLRELDRVGALSTASLDDFVRRGSKIRVVVFATNGAREFVGGEPPPGWARGEGEHPARTLGGPPGGGTRLAEQLLAGAADEIVTPRHESRDGAQRIAAGVRRQGGGAIVVNASSDIAQRLDDVYSLSSLLAQIATATPALAYIIVDDGGGRRVADGPLAARVAAEDNPAAVELDRVIDGARVLERRSPITLGEQRIADLRIGMRLDDVVSGERRTMIRVATGLTTALTLTAVALAFVSLRARFGQLSVQHDRAQEALRRRDRLAAMGELASTVAHEIRNPLNAIAMSTQRLAREYPRPTVSTDAEELDELLGVIQRESARINQTVQQFLDYSRPRPLNRQPVEIATWLSETARAAAAVAKPRGIGVVEDAPAGLVASVDPVQLREAVDNLLRNAIDASSDEGTVRLHAGVEKGDLCISVIDQGPGIAPETLPQIFDLYFTTKPGGTGIGLAVAQQIVTAHGGTIEVDSTPHRGTRMLIRIPPGEATRG